jgi:hypothetical protein
MTDASDSQEDEVDRGTWWPHSLSNIAAHYEILEGILTWK